MQDLGRAEAIWEQSRASIQHALLTTQLPPASRTLGPSLGTQAHASSEQLVTLDVIKIHTFVSITLLDSHALKTSFGPTRPLTVQRGLIPPRLHSLIQHRPKGSMPGDTPGRAPYVRWLAGQGTANMSTLYKAVPENSAIRRRCIYPYGRKKSLE